MSRMKKIGIMGGTFNPIHNGHLRMAQAAMRQYHLEEVLFVPSKNPPHKKKKEIIGEEHRARMICLAIDGISGFSFSDIELKRSGTTYTCDTLSKLREVHPTWELFFILGGDSLESLDDWHMPEKIMNQCTILAAPRYGVNEKDFLALCKEKAEKYSGTVLPVHMEELEISSRAIRENVKKGESLLSICPEKVEKYIALHGLYGAKKHKIFYDDENYNEYITELLTYIEATLRPKRYQHTLGVAQTATTLGFCYFSSDSDCKRAELAGILHDCAKYLTGDEMIQLCEKHKITLTETERINTALIHGKLGAYLAKKRYGIRDAEILSSVQYHTTGKPKMTTLEKIIYVADYIEPGRKMNCMPYSLAEVRKKCYQDLDKGLLMILTNTVEYLKKSDRKIDEMTTITYEYYKERVKL